MSSISQSISLISLRWARAMPSASSRTRRSSMSDRSLVKMAIEWCGIIPRMYAWSSTSAWDRDRYNEAPPRASARPTMARLIVRFLYIMLRMNASMTSAIAAPISSAMYKRSSLHRT